MICETFLQVAAAMKISLSPQSLSFVPTQLASRRRRRNGTMEPICLITLEIRGGMRREGIAASKVCFEFQERLRH